MSVSSPEDQAAFDETELQPGERPATPPVPLREAIGLYLFCIALILTWLIVTQLSGIDLRIFTIVMEAGLVLLPTLYFVQKNRLSFRETLYLNPVSVRILFTVLLITVPFRICSFLISALVQTIFPMPDFILQSVKEMYAELMFPANTLEFALTLLGVVVLAAICEEVMFRGFILTTLKGKMHIGKAIIITAIGFALYHVDPWGFSEYVVVGIFLGWLVVRTESIYPAIIAHAVFNLMAIFILPRIFSVKTVDDFLQISFPPFIYPIAFALFLLLLYIFIQQTKKDDIDHELHAA